MAFSQTDGPFWPPPPAEARIYFLESFSSPVDIGTTKKGIFKAIGDFLIGRKKSRIVRPYDIVVGMGGSRIYVADPGLSAVHVFDRRTRRYHTLSKIRGERLISPIGLALEIGRAHV